MGWADVIISTIITSYKAHQRTECELLWVNDREHSLMLRPGLGLGTHGIFFVFQGLLMLSLRDEASWVRLCVYPGYSRTRAKAPEWQQEPC